MRRSIKWSFVVALLSAALAIPVTASAKTIPTVSVKLRVTSTSFALKGGELEYRIDVTRRQSMTRLRTLYSNGANGIVKVLPIKVRVGDVVEIKSHASQPGFSRSKRQRHKITLLDIRRGGYVFHFKVKWTLLVPEAPTPIEGKPVTPGNSPPAPPEAPPGPPTNPPPPPPPPADPPVTLANSCVHTGYKLPTDGSGDVLLNVHFRIPPSMSFDRANFDTGDGTKQSTAATYIPEEGMWEADGSTTYRFSGPWSNKVTIRFAINGIAGGPPTFVTTEVQAESSDPNHPSCSQTLVLPWLPPLPPPPPQYFCDKLVLPRQSSVATTVRAAVQFTATNGAYFAFATLEWRDGSSSTSSTIVDGRVIDEHEFHNPGTYNVVANITVVLPDGSTATVTGPHCQQTVTIV